VSVYIDILYKRCWESTPGLGPFALSLLVRFLLCATILYMSSKFSLLMLMVLMVMMLMESSIHNWMEKIRWYTSKFDCMNPHHIKNILYALSHKTYMETQKQQAVTSPASSNLIDIIQ
jgi:hypothetical protein